MSVSIAILVLVNVILVIGSMRRSVSPQGVQLDHSLLFPAGVAFYWLVPPLAGLLKPLAPRDAVMQGWYDLFDAVPKTTLATYLALCAVYLLAFAVGSSVRARFAPVPGRPIEIDSSLFKVLWPVCAAVAAYLVWILRGQFFASYSLIFESGGLRGPFMAFSLFLLSIVLLVADSRNHPEQSPPFRARFVTGWAFLYGVTVVGLLGLGGRMYVVTGFVAIMTYWTVFVRPVALGRMLAGVAIAAVLSGIIGSIRYGLAGAEVSGVALTINIFLEPIFTSFSLFDFLYQGRLEPVNFPIQLASQFLNLTPTFLLPNKVELMLEPADLGYSAVAPLGALNSFVSFVINFGTLGTIFVLFIFAFWLEGLRRRSTVLSRVMYAMICGAIPFSLFRDPFYASIVKVIFQLSVLMPLLTVVALHILTRAGEASRLRLSRAATEPSTG